MAQTKVIGKGKFRGIDCNILQPKIKNDDYLLEFDTRPKNIGCWPGSMRDFADPEDLDPNKFYTYRNTDDPDLEIENQIKKSGYRCVECNDFNEYANANLKKDRFICYSCKKDNGWKFKGEFI